MHDHDHDHSHESTQRHDFGEMTSYEETLYRRQQVLHIATEIFKAGVPRGRVGNQFVEQPFYSPQGAVNEAVELIRTVDDYIVSCRKKSVEDDAPAREPEP